jgi:hypothetical protein
MISISVGLCQLASTYALNAHFWRHFRSFGLLGSPGVDGDQAIGLARQTTGNFVAELLRRAYAPFRNELGIASKEIRAGVYHKVGEAALVAGTGAVVYYRPAIVPFVVLRRLHILRPAVKQDHRQHTRVFHL